MRELALIVPCRLESTRFPRKLLHLIHGKPLVLWVAERVRTQCPEIPVWFAVDDALLARPLEAAGFQVLMTRRDHVSGTDRLAEANRSVGASFIINVQADEPLVTGSQIRELARLIRGNVAMATLATPFSKAEDFANPNQVKVVMRGDGRALYFSRSAMPFARDLAGRPDDAWVASQPCFRHLGLYAYTADLLDRFSSLPPGKLEQIEKLEQLRVLENGYDIAVGLTHDVTIGVDTPEDAEKFLKAIGG
ncbi:MAG: 3-deoxy-manno-octulosonate cytidylyltransferase [Opitutaceae bacterium]|nr:3-deoxy-manno-octulosonate cytidylyltransferase [Opitutaceae bacterium]